MRLQKVIKSSKIYDYIVWQNTTEDSINGSETYYVLTDYDNNYIAKASSYNIIEQELKKYIDTKYVIKKNEVIKMFQLYMIENHIQDNYICETDVCNFLVEKRNQLEQYTNKKITVTDFERMEKIIYEKYSKIFKGDIWEITDNEDLENAFEDELYSIYDNTNDKEVLQLAMKLLQNGMARLDSDLDNLKISKEYARLYDICLQLKDVIDNYV